MATLIENAARGQRSAMTTLYEANKQKVYFVARCLLADQAQAEHTTVTAFKEAWSNLESAAIGTEVQFTNYLICRILDHCKEQLQKKNPKALRIPASKSFLVPGNLVVSDAADSALDYVLENLPHTQKYIFVMHTAGGLEVMQIARVLRFNSRTVRAAIDSEAENVKRLLALSGKGHVCAYGDILYDMKQAEGCTAVPVAVDGQMADIIDAIATPIEERERKRKHRISVLSVLTGACVVISLLLFGLTSDAVNSTAVEEYSFTDTQLSDTATGETEVPVDAEETQSDETEEAASDMHSEGLTYYADIEIADYGTVTVELDQVSAPITVENFVELAQSGFYDGLTFHRIIEGFMMQGGDPEGNGTGGSDETIVGEFTDNGYDNTLTHTRGAISMARSSDYNSASSQFFIVHEDSTYLDGQYAVFGYVTEGMDVVDAVCEAAEPTDSNGTISVGEQPVITSVTIRTKAVQ